MIIDTKYVYFGEALAFVVLCVIVYLLWRGYSSLRSCKGKGVGVVFDGKKSKNG